MSNFYVALQKDERLFYLHIKFDTLERIIRDNPCIGVKKLKVEKKKMDFWTLTEFQSFLDLIKLPEEFGYYVLFSTLYLTGMRVGELGALDWADIDFSRREISISKSLFRDKGQDIITPPKSAAAYRRISINMKLINLLKRWQAVQKELFKSRLGIVWYEDTPVFQTNLIRKNGNAIRQKYQKICDRDPTMKRIRIHDFRHSHVALLIENGVELPIIKERLGHASITTTIDTYGHLFPNRQQKAADELDKYF